MYENLTKRYANGNNPNILGREHEIKNLFLTLLRREKPNALLTGEPGVGKTAIIHLLSYLISNKMCPKKLYGFNVLSINTNQLLAGPGYRGVTEDKFQKLIDSSLSEGKTILFFDEFHTVEHLGEMANGQTPGLGNTLKPYLTRPDFRLIGATTREEAAGIKDRALLRRFFEIEVGEPSDEAIRSIILACINEYGTGLTYKRAIIEQILELSKSLDGYNPDKAKGIVDLLCSFCNMENISLIETSTVSSFFDQFYGKSVKKMKVVEQEVSMAPQAID